MKEEKMFRYNDVSERYRKMNRTFIISASCVWGVLLIFLIANVIQNSISMVTGCVNIGLVLFFLIANIVYYSVDKYSRKLKQFVSFEVGLEVLLLGV